MAIQTHPIRRIFARFFPKKYSQVEKQDLGQWSLLPTDQKKDLALHYLSQGELTLLQGNLNALSLFEAASELDGENPEIWYRQGLCFFEYGSEEGKEKALPLASKHFKYATQLDPTLFKAWVAWGNTLLQLGLFHGEHHFYLEAKNKYEKALELSENQPPDALAELYWDYGLAWAEIAKHSGEAVDIRSAIDAFQTSLKLQQKPSPEFLNDYGKAYLEMGLLINDSKLYLQAVQHLQKAVEIAPEYFDGWVSLAESYSQLYINTVDERLITKASIAFQTATKLCPGSSEAWLSWAQILGESGRLNNDPKALHQSIEKCARAATLDEEEPLITAQWVESLSLLGAVTGRIDLLVEAEQKILKATDQYPDDPDLWHAYGICLMSLGRHYEEPDYYEMAIDKLQYGLSIDRSTAEHWHTLGIVHKLYAELTNHEDLLERANRFFQKAMDLKPSCPTILFDAATTLLHFSELTEDLPSLQRALTLLETLLQHHKSVILQHPEWLFEYAAALEWLSDISGDEKELNRAIEIFSHVLLIDPDYPRIHQRMARCYMEMGHHTTEPEFYKKAISFLRLSLKQDEENDQIWLDWGICLIHIAEQTLDFDFMQQLYWDAEQKIAKAGQLGNAGAYYHLACLYSILDRTDEAMRFIEKALSARALPPIEEMLEDEWLDNLRDTATFAQFLTALEAKFQAREE